MIVLQYMEQRSDKCFLTLVQQKSCQPALQGCCKHACVNRGKASHTPECCGYALAIITAVVSIISIRPHWEAKAEHSQNSAADKAAL